MKIKWRTWLITSAFASTPLMLNAQDAREKMEEEATESNPLADAIKFKKDLIYDASIAGLIAEIYKLTRTYVPRQIALESWQNFQKHARFVTELLDDENGLTKILETETRNLAAVENALREVLHPAKSLRSARSFAASGLESTGFQLEGMMAEPGVRKMAAGALTGDLTKFAEGIAEQDAALDKAVLESAEKGITAQEAMAKQLNPYLNAWRDYVKEIVKRDQLRKLVVEYYQAVEADAEVALRLQRSLTDAQLDTFLRLPKFNEQSAAEFAEATANSRRAVSAYEKAAAEFFTQVKNAHATAKAAGPGALLQLNPTQVKNLNEAAAKMGQEANKILAEELTKPVALLEDMAKDMAKYESAQARTAAVRAGLLKRTVVIALVAEAAVNVHQFFTNENYRVQPISGHFDDWLRGYRVTKKKTTSRTKGALDDDVAADDETADDETYAEGED